MARRSDSFTELPPTDPSPLMESQEFPPSSDLEIYFNYLDQEMATSLAFPCLSCTNLNQSGPRRSERSTGATADRPSVPKTVRIETQMTAADIRPFESRCPGAA